MLNRFSAVDGGKVKPVDASYLQARIDAVQDMFDKLDYVSVDMIAIVLGVSLEKYEAKQAEIMGKGLEDDVD